MTNKKTEQQEWVQRFFDNYILMLQANQRSVEWWKQYYIRRYGTGKEEVKL